MLPLQYMKILYIVIGSISLGLGILGIFLPLLPTTPFLMLSAAMYIRGSRRLYDWLISSRFLGTYIRQFMEYRAIPLRAKILSVSMVWITILYCVFYILDNIWLRLILCIIALAVTVHILKYKTLRKNK